MKLTTLIEYICYGKAFRPDRYKERGKKKSRIKKKIKQKFGEITRVLQKITNHRRHKDDVELSYPKQ